MDDFITKKCTPTAKIIRAYIDQTMHKLPEQSSENNRTIWRYHAFVSEYSFIRGNPTSLKRGHYRCDVWHEIVLALLKSDDCRVGTSDVEGLSSFVHFTLRKLFIIQIFNLNN